MNLRLRNPLRGSLEPWPLATRLARFGLTALAILFFHISSDTLKRLVRRHARLTDPQGLPEKPRRIAERLSHLATALLFIGIGLVFAGSLHAIWVILLAIIVCAQIGRYLRRRVWGLPGAFGERTGRVQEVLRRLVQVIRHGHP